eukprot:COSAG02_NODE_328_length_24547_cov_4.124141_28_plen_108_part_00
MDGAIDSYTKAIEALECRGCVGFCRAAGAASPLFAIFPPSLHFSAGCHGGSDCSYYYIPQPTPVVDPGALFCGRSPPLFPFGLARGTGLAVLGLCASRFLGKSDRIS